MWRYWVIFGFGIVIAIIQYLGFTPVVLQVFTALAGLMIAALSFWLISEKRERVS